MLSLSPRYDLFRFAFPKDFLPESIQNKYLPVINQIPSVITTPIDYLNESIQSFTMPGVSDVLIQQSQHGFNRIERSGKNLGRINIEPKHDITYIMSNNILDNITAEFSISFRMNQGLYNYFMIYEYILMQTSKTENIAPYPTLFLEILNETGKVIGKIYFYDVLINGIDGLEFNFSKVEREADSFNVTFKYNNINFEFLE